MRAALTAFCLILSLLATAAYGTEPTLNKEYRLIPQQPTQSGKKIEVIEFFFYGCPYCNELQAPLEEWRKHIPDDVIFRRIPAVRRPTWIPLTKTYFTLEEMGALDRLHPAMYRAYHDDKLSMSQQSVMFAWANKHGLDAKKFAETYISSRTAAKVEQAKQFTKDYQIPGTPSLVVDGKYLTSSGMTEEVADVIPVLDYLIDLARKDRAR
jgi:protein dithiol oxidoreductase (disulfide-forming)